MTTHAIAKKIGRPIELERSLLQRYRYKGNHTPKKVAKYSLGTLMPRPKRRLDVRGIVRSIRTITKR